MLLRFFYLFYISSFQQLYFCSWQLHFWIWISDVLYIFYVNSSYDIFDYIVKNLT